MSQNDDPLIYREEGEIAFIEINRPEKKNALNYECWQLFDKYCDQLNAAKQIRVLVITGYSDDLFSAGVDVTPTDPFIADMFQALQNRDKAKLVEGFAYMQGVVSKLAHLPFPTVAAINGLCYGGAVELACACDISVCRKHGWA
jgi:enoyl-CoA hydratase/carnithine racemase